ncbi:MAG: PIN domain-containing protein [Candidatus Altiarchaeales archaeon]|nr:PIN domain-containing protein [Candidatus Altiarchaeota archaeon]MBU4341993.1 PIN domain-containing protein [Candidatus Altiarchaeota archaeon]MBU4437633.1 PIN domain-containing protein [Candidatus Altiarchaeota archaeon]MCG2783239.1 PIN domain-containing protein [Candidatus Altiarchaeales archaeon]
MKLYLDTNIVLGWFKRTMQNLRKEREFKVPAVMEFLSSKEGLDLIVSNLTEAEIIRYLISEWNCDAEFSKDVWKQFVDRFSITYLKPDVDLDELIIACSKIPTRKRTMTNLLHLHIAKKYGLWFLTGEENLSDRYKFYYKKIFTYKELRQRLSPP